ncbi:MAG: DUF4296 domain-containing protein [Bacteroidetes bacterium]|nr:MAG: DUF4296 domain-containing protein [Bacteroidota bacterium]
MYKILIIFIVFLLCSCQEDEAKQNIVPEKLLTRDQMVHVLVDLELAEAAVTMTNLPNHAAIFRFKRYEKQIFGKHSIDSTVYQQNFEFYMKRLVDAEYIHRGVLDSMLIRKNKKIF